MHLDLFSGIGGFALAAREAGFETIAFCEADQRCRTFLERTWGLPVEPDVRQLDGRNYRGISLLTGGPPCQPASRAGKQGGASDDRWLWGEALRVLAEAEPDCVVFENPPGILDVGIDGILSEMGRLGYEVQPLDIPACAVDSPQLRHRIWIVGFLANTKRGSGNGSLLTSEREEIPRTLRPSEGGLADTGRIGSRQDEQGRRPDRRAVDGRAGSDELADTTEPRHEGPDAERIPDGRGSECVEGDDMGNAESLNGRCELQSGESRQNRRAVLTGAVKGHWQNCVWVPCADGKLRRAPDDSFELVDGLHRSLLAALGNSIVWQVAVPILAAIRAQLHLSCERGKPVTASY